MRLFFLPLLLVWSLGSAALLPETGFGGVDLGLSTRRVPDTSRSDSSLAKGCIDAIRCFYFMVGIFYEVISTSNCLSEEADAEVRGQLSRRLSELGYYRNFLAEVLLEEGGHATFFENTRELPKRNTSSRTLCQQLELIGSRETYIVWRGVLVRLLNAVSGLKESFVLCERTGLESPPLILSLRNEIVSVLNLTSGIVHDSLHEVRRLEKLSSKSQSIFMFPRSLEAAQTIESLRKLLKVQLLQFVRLRRFASLGQRRLLNRLEYLESNNQMPPRH